MEGPHEATTTQEAPPAPIAMRVRCLAELLDRLLRRGHQLKALLEQYDLGEEAQKAGALDEAIETFSEDLELLENEGIEDGVLDPVPEGFARPLVSGDFLSLDVVLCGEGWQPPVTAEATP